MNKLKFTYKDFKAFQDNIDKLDSNNIDYTIETDYEDSYFLIINK